MAIIEVKVEHGTGKWAYWRVRGESVVADKTCNEGAVHFAGRFTQEVMNAPCRADLMTDGFVAERPKSIWAQELESEYDG